MQLGQFLIERLINAGVKHTFGIPGDYVLDFYKMLYENEHIEVINNTDENHSGFAADAYARVAGVGCVVTTYSVGASKVINAIQCAYAERSPLILISGAPGLEERTEGMLLHHMVKSFNSQKKMFEEITCATVVLDDLVRACYEIDRAFECLKYYKRPIYIELPRDMVRKTVSYDVYNLGTPIAPATDKEILVESVEEVEKWLSKAERPAILAGVEVARYGLGEKLIKFAERCNIPVATTLLSKSVINERHKLFAGIYSGAMSNDCTRDLIENSDCLLLLGVMLTDMTLCFKPKKFHRRNVVACRVDNLRIKNHTFTNVQFADFCEALFRLNIETKQNQVLPIPRKKKIFEPKSDTKITCQRLFECIDGILDKNMAIVADIGDSLFGAADLTVHHSNHFLSPAFYTSMGSAIPGALGVQKANPKVRPIVIVGDGAAQMSLVELSTIVKHGLNPIVFVLNNDGYTTERFLADGGFNDLQPWDYHMVWQLIGGGTGSIVTDEETLDLAVKSALDAKMAFVINVVIDRNDVSNNLRRMTEILSKKI
jgi:indolepyruvate decarboxylase